MSHPTDLIAYTYRADHWHPECVVAALWLEGRASPAAFDMDPEDVLRQVAGAEGIDYGNEHSYDSGDFPKPVFADTGLSELHDDVCGGCLRPVVQPDECGCEWCADTAHGEPVEWNPTTGLLAHHSARNIAAEWHGGQASALYALTSSGAIADGAEAEARRCANGLAETPRDQELLAALIEYVRAHGD